MVIQVTLVLFCLLVVEDIVQDITISEGTIRPMFDLSSVSWYNRVRSLTTSRNRLYFTLPYVSQYPHVFYILSNFLNFPLINKQICHEFGFVYVYRHIYWK